MSEELFNVHPASFIAHRKRRRNLESFKIRLP